MNSCFQVLSRVVLLFVPLAVGEKRNVASVAETRSKVEAVVFSHSNVFGSKLRLFNTTVLGSSDACQGLCGEQTTGSLRSWSQSSP